MKKYLFYFLLITISCNNLYSNEVDSLEKLLPFKTGVIKAIILNKLGATYEQIDPDKRLVYSIEALSLGKKFKVDSIIARANMNIAICYYYKSKTDSTISYFELALAQYQKLKDSHRIGSCLTNLGSIYNTLGNTEKAVNCHLQSLAIAEARKDSSAMSKVLNNLGTTLNDADKTDMSIEYFQRALNIRLKTKDTLNFASTYRNIAWAYLEKASSFVCKKNYYNNYTLNIFNPSLINDSIKKYLQKSLYCFKNATNYYYKKNNIVEIAIIKSPVASIMYCLNNIDESIKLLEEAKYVLYENEKLYEATKVFINLGSFYESKGEYSKALENIHFGLKIAEEQKYAPIAIAGYYELIKSYKAIKNFEKSQFYSDKLIILQDSLQKADNLKTVNELEIKYKTNIKDAELKFAQEREDLLEEENYYLIAISILLVISSILFYLRYRYKNKISKILKSKNYELTKLNFEIDDSRLKLKEANDTKDKFFSIIAHDLKSPIGSFKNLTEILSNSYFALDIKEQQNFISLLSESSKKVYNLLENLLTWSRTQTNRINFSLENIDLNFLITLAIDSLSTLAEEKQICIINKVKENTICLVDENMINTVFRNLISNAIKFTKNNGKIIIESTIDEENNELLFSVTDNGIGMSKEIINKLFRIDTIVREKGTNDELGTGLGLIICKEFIEKHKGRIWAESEVAKGSTFYFTLPRILSIS